MKSMHYTVVLLGGAMFCSLAAKPLSADTIGYWRFEEGTADSTVATAVSQVNSSTMDATQASGNVAAVKYSSDVAGPQVFDPISGTTTANTLSMLAPTFVPPSGGSQSKLVAGNSQGTVGQGDFTFETFLKIAIPSGSALTQINLTDFTSIAGIDATSPNRWTPRIITDGKVNARVVTSGSTAIEPTVNSPTVEDGQWHHIAVTLDYNSTTNETTVAVFLDYVNTATVTKSGQVVLNGDLGFGRLAGTDGEYDWHFDEIRLSSGVLSANQFLQIVPEPGAMGVMGLGLFAMTLRRPGAVSR